MDVLAIKLQDYGETLPGEYRQNLTIIQSFLEEQREHAYAELQKDLHSQRYQKLIHDWRIYLEDRLQEPPTGKNGLTILEHANKKTWRSYRLVLEEGRSITDDSPATALHELRKTCKKLRYLIDFFSDLHEPSSVRRLIKILKKLQNFLGNFQDCEAHLELLRRFQQQSRLPANVQISFLLINEFLIAELHQREAAMRGDFAAKFTAFDKPETHELIKSMYHSA
jgi:CHAD domain-containing protein